VTGAELRAAIEVEARALGFGALRVAGVEPLDMERYDAFLARGWHGEMAWLAASRDDRADARRVLAGSV
jgi:epoxyqueuosine reductase QueG